MATSEPVNATDAECTVTQMRVYNSFTQLRMFLEDCVVPRYADGHDPEISGKRHPMQVKEHTRMVDTLCTLYDHFLNTELRCSIACERMPRRHGQTTMMAQFAAGYALCLGGSIIELRIPTFVFTCTTDKNGAVWVCHKSKAEQEEANRDLHLGSKLVEYDGVDYVLSIITDSINACVHSSGHKNIGRNDVCVRKDRSLFITWQGHLSRVHVTLIGCSDQDKAFRPTDVDLVMTDTEEHGLRVDFYNRIKTE